MFLIGSMSSSDLRKCSGGFAVEVEFEIFIYSSTAAVKKSMKCIILLCLHAEAIKCAMQKSILNCS